MCLIVQVFYFFIVNIKKSHMIFYNFLTSWHTYWQFIWTQNKVQDKCAHLHVMTDNRWGIMVCSSVFQGTGSASLDIWTPLDNFFWTRWLALSLSLSLSLPLSVCLSVCLSVHLSLSLTHSNSVTVSLSLSLSLPHLPLVLSSRIDICLPVLKNTCQNCYSRTVKQLQAHHGRE